MCGSWWRRLLRCYLELARLHLSISIIDIFILRSHERIWRLFDSLRKWSLRNNIGLLVPHNFNLRLKRVFSLLLLWIWIRGQRKYFAFAILWACSVRILWRVVHLFLSFPLHLNQLLVLLFNQQYDFCAHYNFALSKSIREKLLDRNLWLVRVKVSQKNFVRILNEAVVTLGLQLKSIIGDKFGH